VQSPPSERSPSILSAIFRYKLTILGVWIVASGASFYAAALLPNRFRADASILFKFGREFLYRSEVGTESASIYKLVEMVNTEIEILKSYDLARKVASDIGPLEMYPDLAEPGESVAPEKLVEKAAARIRSDTSVGATAESGVVKISFEHEKVKLAVKVVNLLIQHFLDKHLEIFAEPKSDFLVTQCQTLENKREETEKDLRKLREKHLSFDIPKQIVHLLTQQADLQSQLQTTETGLLELRPMGEVRPINGDSPESRGSLGPMSAVNLADQKQAMARQRELMLVSVGDTELTIAELGMELTLLDDLARAGDISAHPRTENRYLSLDQAQQKLLDLKLKESGLLRTYTESSEEVLGVRREIEAVENFVKERQAQIEKAIRGRITGELDVLQNRRTALSSQLSQLSRQSQILELVEARQERIRLETRRTALAQQIKKLDETLMQLAEAREIQNRLEREMTLNEEAYRTYSIKLEEARISENLNRQKIVNVHVIDQASEPLKSTAPSSKTRIVLSTFVGLVAGLGMGLLRALFAAA